MNPSGKIKQRTVNGQTISLHQLKNTFREIEDTPYMYEVRLDGSPLDDPVFRKHRATEAFEATIKSFAEPAGRDGGGDRRDGPYGGDGLFGAGLF